MNITENQQWNDRAGYKFFQIKTENCLFIGDKETDEAAAKRVK